MAVLNALQAVTRHAVREHSLVERCNDRCLRALKLGFSGALIFEVIIAFGLARHVVYTEGHDKDGYTRFLRLASCGSAGVGLATALLHLFREAEVQMDIVQHGHTHFGNHSPLVYNCFLGVYFLLLLADRVLRRPKGFDDDEDSEARVSTIKFDFDVRGTGLGGREEYREDSDLGDPKHKTIGANDLGSSQFSGCSHTTVSAAARIAFECVALGSGSHIVLVTSVFVAIASRTWAVAASLAAKFHEGNLTRRAVIVLIITLSSAAPLGVGLGAALAEAGNIVRASVTVLMGGMFFYFSACSTPADEFVENRDFVMAKFCLMAFGASVVVVITVILAATHSY